MNLVSSRAPLFHDVYDANLHAGFFKDFETLQTFGSFARFGIFDVAENPRKFAVGDQLVEVMILLRKGDVSGSKSEKWYSATNPKLRYDVAQLDTRGEGMWKRTYVKVVVAFKLCDRQKSPSCLPDDLVPVSAMSGLISFITGT